MDDNYKIRQHNVSITKETFLQNLLNIEKNIFYVLTMSS